MQQLTSLVAAVALATGCGSSIPPTKLDTFVTHVALHGEQLRVHQCELVYSKDPNPGANVALALFMIVLILPLMFAGGGAYGGGPKGGPSHHFDRSDCTAKTVPLVPPALHASGARS